MSLQNDMNCHEMEKRLRMWQQRDSNHKHNQF